MDLNITLVSFVVAAVFGAFGCGHSHSGAQPGAAAVNVGSLPLADPDTERRASAMFRSGLSPEEFAARVAHEVVEFTYDRYRYRQPGLTEWVHRLGDIIFQRNGAPPLRELRRRFLTKQEINAIELEQAQAP